MERVGVARRAPEAIAVEEFRIGNLTQAELRTVLGFGTRGALDACLEARSVYTDSEDLDQERRDPDRLGL